MDHRRFLATAEDQVLPYFGGTRIDARDRPLRLSQPPESPGWYRFRVQGRRAKVMDRADAPDLVELPLARGYYVADRLFREGGKVELLWLVKEPPPSFSPVLARRWPSGEQLLQGADFETEVEESVRTAASEGRGLANLAGVPAPLRAAFAFAVLEAISRQLGIPAAPSEVQGSLLAVAEQGAIGARRVLLRLAEERRRYQAFVTERARLQLEAEAARERAWREAEREAELRRRSQHAIGRAEEALQAAGARMLSARPLGNGLLEVSFAFLEERFLSVVEAASLQVVDSGICLGHPTRDRLLTLDSLPAVIREAVRTDQLVIFRS